MFKTIREWLLENEKHEFSCVLYNLDKEYADKILKWSIDNIPEENLYQEGEDFGLEDEPHVTVLYGLHTEKPDSVESIMNKVTPFPLKLTVISKFGAEKYDVLKVGVESQGLHEANSKLRKLPYTNKYDEYIPHCTLAYVKKGSCDHLLEKEIFNDIQCTVNSVVFSSSNGDKTEIRLNG